MKIGELASHTGLNASAIRYYEKCGVLAAPYRIGGQRRYPTDAVHRVLLIRFASEMGFTLSEIKLFLSGLRDKAPVGPRWRKLASRKIKEVDETIERCGRLKSLLELKFLRPGPRRGKPRLYGRLFLSHCFYFTGT